MNQITMLLLELLIEAKMVNRNGVSVNEDSPRIWSDQKVHYKSNLLLDNFLSCMYADYGQIDVFV